MSQYTWMLCLHLQIHYKLYRTLNVTCHRTALIMWRWSADICVSTVESNKPPKTVHNQFAVPLSTNRLSKWHIWNGNVLAALQCIWQHGGLRSCHIVVWLATGHWGSSLNEGFSLPMLRETTTVLQAALCAVPSYVFRVQSISDSVW